MGFASINVGGIIIGIEIIKFGLLISSCDWYLFSTGVMTVYAALYILYVPISPCPRGACGWGLLGLCMWGNTLPVLTNAQDQAEAAIM